MKPLVFLIAVFLFPLISFSQNTPLTVSFKFNGIVEGYDHICKTQVWVDGVMLGESEEVKESAGGSFSITVPSGERLLRIVNLALYEGMWEEHTVENDYSIDCVWEEMHEFGKKKSKIFLLFDIDSETLVSWKKMPKPAKK